MSDFRSLNSFAAAALISGRIDAVFARFVRPWTLIAGRHDLLDIVPHAFQRRRMIGDRLPKIVDPVDASRRFNIRINGCDLRRGFIFLDERGQCSVS
jgi:hypothetical protein